LKLERIDHPLANQRVRGMAALDVTLAGGRTRVARLYQEGAAKIRLPHRDGDPLEAILINTAGGMTGGDRLDWSFGIGAGAAAIFTTQACEKAYRSSYGQAEIRTVVNVASGGHVAWLPQETILYDLCALDRRLDIELAVGATALICEAAIFGRGRMGETIGSGRTRDAWRIRRDGRLVHAENLAFSGNIAASLARNAVARKGAAIATVLLVSPDAGTHLDAMRELIGDSGGASAWSTRDGADGKLLARLVAKDGYELRRRLVPVLELLNGQAALPKVWSL